MLNPSPHFRISVRNAAGFVPGCEIPLHWTKECLRLTQVKVFAMEAQYYSA